jgi:trigger factor
MLQKFIQEHSFEVPQSIVNEQAQRMAEQSLQQYYQMGLNPEMFGMTPQSMMGQFLEGAETQVRRALIINRIVEMETLSVSNEDLKAEIARAAEMSGMSTEDISRELVQNQQQLMALQNDLLADKVFAYLLTVNTVTEKAMTRGEFEQMKMDEAQKANEDEVQEDEAPAEKKPAKKASTKKKATTTEEESESDTEEKPKAKKPRAKKVEE